MVMMMIKAMIRGDHDDIMSSATNSDEYHENAMLHDVQDLEPHDM